MHPSASLSLVMESVNFKFNISPYIEFFFSICLRAILGGLNKFGILCLKQSFNVQIITSSFLYVMVILTASLCGLSNKRDTFLKQ